MTSAWNCMETEIGLWQALKTKSISLTPNSVTTIFTHLSLSLSLVSLSPKISYWVKQFPSQFQDNAPGEHTWPLSPHNIYTHSNPQREQARNQQQQQLSSLPSSSSYHSKNKKKEKKKKKIFCYHYSLRLGKNQSSHKLNLHFSKSRTQKWPSNGNQSSLLVSRPTTTAFLIQEAMFLYTIPTPGFPFRI